jgi:hypothetical protein
MAGVIPSVIFIRMQYVVCFPPYEYTALETNTAKHYQRTVRGTATVHVV